MKGSGETVRRGGPWESQVSPWERGDRENRQRAVHGFPSIVMPDLGLF